MSEKKSRKKITTQSPSYDKIKEKIRKEFKEHYKSKRSINFDKRRNAINTIVSEFTANDVESIHELDPDELLKILTEIDEENLQMQAEWYCAEEQAANNALVQNYLCQICGVPLDVSLYCEKQVCDKCIEVCFSNDNI